MHRYHREAWTPEEAALLARYVTDLDGPVFALRNLPEVVKGALYARYSRSPKSLRRLLLDEFAVDLGGSAEAGLPGDEAESRAARLYARVFDEYGDDSVAQLGGAHVAVEQASNLLTKVLEWGRLAAYLEQSTRYMRYDDRPDGRYRYYRDPDIAASGHGEDYERTLDGVFDAYGALFEPTRAWVEQRWPRDADVSEAVYRNTVTAKTCDLLRGLLPAATLSNVGIFASGQSYEQMLLRMRGSELAEARATADRMLAELRRVIPSFLTRVDRPERGGVWTEYLAATRRQTRALAAQLLAETAEGSPSGRQPEVTLEWWTPDADVELVTGILYPHAVVPESAVRARVARMSDEERVRVVREFAGDRSNRRHKPGRALERIAYRFDICADYGGFRDLQRHRMLTIEWQDLSARHGYDVPPELVEAGLGGGYERALEDQAGLWERLHADLPAQSQYAVGFAWRIRYAMHLNARAAMQLIELRTTPQGHPGYRRVAQEMHRLIAEEAGHVAVAEMMRFADHGAAELERLDSERAAEARREARAGQAQPGA